VDWQEKVGRMVTMEKKERLDLRDQKVRFRLFILTKTHTL